MSTREHGWRRLSNTMRNDRYLPDHQFRISLPHSVAQLHIVHPSRRLPRKFYPTFTARRALTEIYSLIRAKSLLFQWGPLSTSEMYVVDCCTPRSSTSYSKRGYQYYEEIVVPPPKAIPPRATERLVPIDELDDLARKSFPVRFICLWLRFDSRRTLRRAMPR